jgi:hypothetical protein
MRGWIYTSLCQPACRNSVLEWHDIVLGGAPGIDDVAWKPVKDLAIVNEVAERVQVRGSTAVERNRIAVDNEGREARR